MTQAIKESLLKELEKIPNVGRQTAEDLALLGIRSLKDLKKRDPEKLYHQLCNLKGNNVDRCVLYIFRSVVYFASHRKHDPKLLKWWSWKDEVQSKEKSKKRSKK
jgi:recombinational DNA repair protein RecR